MCPGWAIPVNETFKSVVFLLGLSWMPREEALEVR